MTYTLDRKKPLTAYKLETVVRGTDNVVQQSYVEPDEDIQAVFERVRASNALPDRVNDYRVIAVTARLVTEPVAFKYQIEYRCKGPGGWGLGEWKLYTPIHVVSDDEAAKEYFENFMSSFQESVHPYFRLVRSPVDQWEPVE